MFSDSADFRGVLYTGVGFLQDQTSAAVLPKQAVVVRDTGCVRRGSSVADCVSIAAAGRYGGGVQRPPGTHTGRRWHKIDWELVACGWRGHEIVGTDLTELRPNGNAPNADEATRPARHPRSRVITVPCSGELWERSSTTVGEASQPA